MDNIVPRKGSSTLSKSRYRVFKDELSKVMDESTVTTVLSVLCDVLKFDPDKNTYEDAKKTASRQGETTYTKYSKDYYERHKVDLNKQRVESRRSKTKST